MLATLLLAAALAAAAAPTSTASTTAISPTQPSEAEIRKILVERVDAQRRSIGIVAGVVDPSGRTVVAHGVMEAGRKRPLASDTIFEIGSITKVFTATLLADAVARGEVALGDPVSKYLPAGVKMPSRGGKEITLQHLAMHTSGLPRLPSNFAPKDPTNPYADYTVAQLHEFLSSYQLTRDIGSAYEYSNIGAGLLGHVLARRAGMTFEQLLRERITKPLGMNDTFISMPKNAAARFAGGHDAEGNSAPSWDLPTIAGAGAIRSTVPDLLTFLAAQLGLSETPLTKAMRMTTEPRQVADRGMSIALGWHVNAASNGNEVFWHNGGTGGYRSFIGFDPKRRLAVALLTNTSTNEGVDDIGRHLLDPGSALAAFRTQVTVAPDVLESYTGRYELAPGAIINVTRDGSRLYAQLTGQPRFEIYPESNRKFFYKVVDAQITFGVKSLTLHQNWRDLPAKKLEGAAAAETERKEIAVDEALLGRYAGRYQLTPDFIITVTREGNRLYAQATGQPRFEIFAESRNKFFFKVVNAQITFENDRLILHQNGLDQPAMKMK